MTTTDLAIPDSPAALVRYEQPMTGLMIWAEEARQANLAARSLARTAFVPRSLIGRHPDPEVAFEITVSQITAAILTGNEMGMSPMASLRSVDLIEGTPAFRALALRGIVQSKGHKIWVEVSTETRAIVCGIRRGEDITQKSVWTIERAQKLGVTSKDNWRKQPTAMLIARATSEVCRWVGGDAILGMPYSAEELSDELDMADLPVVPVEAPKRRTAQRKALPAAAVEPVPVPSEPPAPPLVEPVQPDEPKTPQPDLDPPVPVSAPPAPEDPDAITAAQLRKLHTLLGLNGLGDRNAGLSWLGEQVGRALMSSKELTRAEASDVIDVLEAPPADPEDDTADQAGDAS